MSYVRAVRTSVAVLDRDGKKFQSPVIKDF